MENINPDGGGAHQYNETYFEAGLAAGISGYMNYSWMPERTIRMAHKFIHRLPIAPGEVVLDFGCAKGFLVKAFRILDVEAHGADISEYAISQAPSEVKNFCTQIQGCGDDALFERTYHWLIAKDVFEHVPEEELRVLLKGARPHVKKIFAAIPLAADDESGKYIIPAYDRDVTHIIAKTKEWWSSLFESEGWKIDSFSHSFDGCKENWMAWEKGNGFFILSSG